MNREELVKTDHRLHIILEELIVVTHMMEDGEACNQILQKIATAQRALRVLGCSLIACQLRETIALIQSDPDPETQSINLSRLRDLYLEVIRTPFLKNEVKP
jgi:DNA-binding FrmR family transcriptional regulator